MLVDAKQLRWLGLDMRSIGRRRAAVVLTYAAFLIAVWVPLLRTYQVVQLLFYAGLLQGLWAAIEEAFSVWARRLAAALALSFAVWVIWHPPSQRDHPQQVFIVAMWAVTLLVSGSILGFSKLVERGNGGWMAEAIRHGATASWRTQRRLARMGFAVGVDGFAWYEYMSRFKRLTPDQQQEIEQLHRANPRGKWMRDHAAVLFDDERLRREDDHIRAIVQRIMSFVLGLSAFVAGLAQTFDWPIHRDFIAAYLWTLAALAMTLRQAIVLWTEPDPRSASDELELVQPQEA